MDILFVGLATRGFVARVPVHPVTPGPRYSVKTECLRNNFKPIDPDVQKKYTTLVPQERDISKVTDLRTAPAHGHLAVLLIGFSQPHFTSVKDWFATMAPDTPVLCCKSESIDGQQTLGEVLEDSSQNEQQWEPAPDWFDDSIAFFSGLSGEDVVAIVENWTLFTNMTDPPAFAISSPRTEQKSLKRLIHEIARESSLEQDALPVSAAGKKEEGAFYLIDSSGRQMTSPMDMNSLKEQVRGKVQKKLLAKKREPDKDETDRVHDSLVHRKKGKGKKSVTGFGQ